MKIAGVCLVVCVLVIGLLVAFAPGGSKDSDSKLPALQKANERTIPDLGMDLIWIPSSKEAGPPFWLGRTEGTQKQWTGLMDHNFSEFKGEDLPVQNVHWKESVEFCRKLTAKEHADGRLPVDFEFSLPNDAQWEFACRAGTKGDYPGVIDDIAWCFVNSGGKPHSVASKRPNDWGLYDMLGNVAEWCMSGASANSGVPELAFRSIRGGSWRVAASQTSITFRILYSQADRENTVGFRVALSAVAVNRVQNGMWDRIWRNWRRFPSFPG